MTEFQPIMSRSEHAPTKGGRLQMMSAATPDENREIRRFSVIAFHTRFFSRIDLISLAY